MRINYIANHNHYLDEFKLIIINRNSNWLDALSNTAFIRTMATFYEFSFEILLPPLFIFRFILFYFQLLSTSSCPLNRRTNYVCKSWVLCSRWENYNLINLLIKLAQSRKVIIMHFFWCLNQWLIHNYHLSWPCPLMKFCLGVLDHKFFLLRSLDHKLLILRDNY